MSDWSTSVRRICTLKSRHDSSSGTSCWYTQYLEGELVHQISSGSEGLYRQLAAPTPAVQGALAACSTEVVPTVELPHGALGALPLAAPVSTGFLSFLWFVAFCFLANQWQRTTMSKGALQGADAARAAIAFSFFSIIVWVALALKALQRYRLGTDMSLFATDQFATDPNAAYPGYPTGSGIESTETYQSPPFTETSDTNPKGYQVPAY
uniref:Synaptogyrin 3 n=1 Tax=Gallus gallus TaxID=9031 RepID=A0A8V0Z0V2_CHICK